MRTLMTAAMALAVAVLPAYAQPKQAWANPEDARALADIAAAERGRQELEAQRALGRQHAAKQQWNAAAGGGLNWSFRIYTNHSANGWAQVEPTYYGPFSSEQQCEQTLAEKVGKWQLDPEHPDAPVTRIFSELHRKGDVWRPVTVTHAVTTQVGATSVTNSNSVTREENRSPTEQFVVEHCLPNVSRTMDALTPINDRQ
jgi:hypothetical protein